MPGGIWIVLQKWGPERRINSAEYVQMASLVMGQGKRYGAGPTFTSILYGGWKIDLAWLFSSGRILSNSKRYVWRVQGRVQTVVKSVEGEL